MYLIILLTGLSALFETFSYLRQVRKTLRRHTSNDVSAKAYRDKLVKYIFGIAAVSLAHNWVGLFLETWAFILCMVTYITIKRNK